MNSQNTAGNKLPEVWLHNRNGLFSSGSKAREVSAEHSLSKLIRFGDTSLRRVVSNFLEHFHHERNHQGKGNLLLFPAPTLPDPAPQAAVRCRERLVGLLKYYSRAA